MFDEELPLGGAADAAARRCRWGSTRPAPRRGNRARAGDLLARYFDNRGYSLVAGQAALLSRATGPTDEARDAVLAGAAAILVDGLVPAGALGLDDRLDVPVVGLPPSVAASVRSALARGSDVSVSLGAPGWRANERLTRVAPSRPTASPSAAASSRRLRSPASSW